MDYFHWKGRIDVCGMILLFSMLIGLLLLPVGITDFQEQNYIPVEIKYPLSEIPENQAVLVKMTHFSALRYDLIVNKAGRWKLLDYYEVEEEYYAGKTMDHTFYDSVLQDDSIPWQDKKITINPYFLERALNMPEVEFKREPLPQSPYVVMTLNDWYIFDNSPERQQIHYDMTLPLKYDYTVIYIQNKMKQIDSLGFQIFTDKHQIPTK